MLVTARPAAPLGISAPDLGAALRSGARLVDVRSQTDRNRDGVIPGAVALGSEIALDRLTPGSPVALRSASPREQWVVVATDAYDAEWLTWHLHARGVRRARFLLGGARALRRPSGDDGVSADRRTPPLAITPQDRRDLALIAAH